MYDLIYTLVKIIIVVWVSFSIVFFLKVHNKETSMLVNFLIQKIVNKLKTIKIKTIHEIIIEDKKSYKITDYNLGAFITQLYDCVYCLSSWILLIGFIFAGFGMHSIILVFCFNWVISYVVARNYVSKKLFDLD